MTNEPIVITRESLYEQVWAEPISKIAARFNLSDRGLAKLCARFDIPVPPRGWWAKKQHGHRVKPSPLPATGRVKPITIHKWWAPPVPPKPDAVPAEIAFERDPANRPQWSRLCRDGAPTRGLPRVKTQAVVQPRHQDGVTPDGFVQVRIFDSELQDGASGGAVSVFRLALKTLQLFEAQAKRADKDARLKGGTLRHFSV